MKLINMLIFAGVMLGMLIWRDGLKNQSRGQKRPYWAAVRQNLILIALMSLLLLFNQQIIRPWLNSYQDDYLMDSVTETMLESYNLTELSNYDSFTARTLKLAEETYGKESLMLTFHLEALADGQLKRGRTDEAVLLLNRALNIKLKHWSNEDPRLIPTREKLRLLELNQNLVK